MKKRIRQHLKNGWREAALFFSEHRLDPLPIRKGWQGYGTRAAGADIQAGLNVALLAFPQGMAYAVIADLPIQYGIIAGAVAAMVCFFRY